MRTITDMDFDDRIERIAKIEINQGDIVMVFVDLSGMSQIQTERTVERMRAEFEKVFPSDVKVVIVHKNVDIAVVSKVSSQEKSDAS